MGSMFGTSIGAKGEQHPEQPGNIEITIECSLQEFYQGSLRTIKFDRMELHHDPKHAKRF